MKKENLNKVLVDNKECIIDLNKILKLILKLNDMNDWIELLNVINKKGGDE